MQTTVALPAVLSQPPATNALTASAPCPLSPMCNLTQSMHQQPATDAVAESLNNLVVDDCYPSAVLTPEQRQATVLMIDVNKRYWSKTGYSDSPMHYYIDLGRRIQQVEDLLGSAQFEDTFRHWQRTMTVGFRLHVARRYLLVARNAEAILAAGITNVMEAERFASKREYVARWRGDKLRTPASNDAPQAITDRELALFAEVGQLPFDAQATYLQQLADKLAGALQP